MLNLSIFGSDNEGYETQIVVQCSKDTLHTIQHDPRPGPTYYIINYTIEIVKQLYIKI